MSAEFTGLEPLQPTVLSEREVGYLHVLALNAAGLKQRAISRAQFTALQIALDSVQTRGCSLDKAYEEAARKIGLSV